MAGVRVSKVKTARDRAREARAALLAGRAHREQQLMNAATAYFAAEQDYVDAQARVRAAETAMARALETMLALDEPVADVAAMCELSESEVRRLRRLASESTDTDATENVAPVPETPEGLAPEGSPTVAPSSSAAATSPALQPVAS